MITRLVAALLLSLTAMPVCAQSPAPDKRRFEVTRDIKGALVDSLTLVSMEHALRITFQEKTRAELSGPFWSDYNRSVRWPRQWTDTDSWGVNYVGHPIHGAAAGIIWLDHAETHTAKTFLSREYLASRARAAAFSAVYSLQFEIGPFSEASIGNVGMRPETAGWVDYVVTPAGALGIMIAEDALDRSLVRWIETRVSNRAVRATVRLAFGPSRLLANSAEKHLPWYRPDRPLDWR